jgi:hypothetical protein
LLHVEVELGEDDLGQGVLHGAAGRGVEGLGSQQVENNEEDLGTVSSVLPTWASWSAFA